MADNQQAVWDQTYAIRKNKKKFTRVVAEGDSWFCYPMWRSMMDYVSQSDLFALVRRGESGRHLRQIATDRKYLAAVQTEKPLAVLISGSGNDFVNHDFVTGDDGNGRLFRIYSPGATPSDLIDEAKWQSKLDELADYFDDIVKQVDGLPVITHGYDYIKVSGRPALYDGIKVGGPWIKPTLDDPCHVPVELHADIARLMIDSLNDMMASVAQTHPTFVHVDLRGRVQPDDWANEIHPYKQGFEVLADGYLKQVKKTLGI